MSPTPTMTARITAFRRAKAGVERHYRSQPYPLAVREQALELRAALMDQGLSDPQIATRLGLRIETLRRWVETARTGLDIEPSPAVATLPTASSLSATARLLPVTLLSAPREPVAPPPPMPAAHATLVSPDGWRVEGLDLDQIVELLNRVAPAARPGQHSC